MGSPRIERLQAWSFGITRSRIETVGPFSATELAFVRIGIIQSSFIPWRGYFDFIASVDRFVFLDDTQYTQRNWRNRNRIKTAAGTKWITVPVHYRHQSQLICDTEIDQSSNWPQKHLAQWRLHYGQTPFLGDVLEILDDLPSHGSKTISDLNIKLIRHICQYLHIETPLIMSVELDPQGRKTERLIDIVKKLGGDTYLSGPSADAYLDHRAFASAGIGLEYKRYEYAPYPQAWGAFDGEVSVLDLIANCGRDAAARLRSMAPDRVIVASRNAIHRS